jgi:hypothetical protein
MTILCERYKLWSSSLWSLLHSPFSSLLGPNISLRILFSNNLSLHSSLNVRDHVSQPYSTTHSLCVVFKNALSLNLQVSSNICTSWMRVLLWAILLKFIAGFTECMLPSYSPKRWRSYRAKHVDFKEAQNRFCYFKVWHIFSKNITHT